MKITTSAIPHRYRNRFLRDSNSNVAIADNTNINNYSGGGSGSESNNFEPHYLWGQYFDDTEDIDGDLICNGTIQGNKGIFGDLKVNGLADINTLQAVSGYIQTLLSDEISCDYLTVTKAAHFFKLMIDEIKATQGQVIITPANAKIDKVEVINGGWRCYYRAKDEDGGQIYNCFEVNDQVVCQTFDAATGTSYDVSNQYYWRLVTATGTTTTTIDGETRDVHYFDLSSSDCDNHSMTPKVGDNCVQLGNRTDTTRQAAIIISAYNNQFLDKNIKAPSIVQYAGINNYDLSTHRLNIISNGLNQFKGSYNNNSGVDIEQIITVSAETLDGKITTLNGTVTSHTQSISELTQTDNQIKSTVSANTTSIGTLTNKLNTISGTVSTNTTNIATLQQTATGLTSTVSQHTQQITAINNADYQHQIDSLEDDYNGIKRDYVTSSKLQQTATSITASITDSLGDTGIDITSGNIVLQADKTKIKASGNGSASQLKVYDYQGNEQMRLVAQTNGASILMSAYDGSHEVTRLDKNYLTIRNSNGNNYITLDNSGSNPKLTIGKYISVGNYKEFSIEIDGSGNVYLDGTFTNSAGKHKLYIDANGYLRVN